MANYALDAPAKKLPVTEFSLDELMGSMEKSISQEKPAAVLGFFGGPGSSKTTTAMRMAQHLKGDGNIILVDSAKGRSTLIGDEELTKDVIPMQFHKMEQLWALADAIESGAKKVFEKTTVIVLDEYSSMAQYDVNWVTETRAKVAHLEGEYKDPYKPEWPDYRTGAIRSLKTLTKFLNLEQRVHIILVAHDKFYEKEGKGGITRPDMPNATNKDFERLIHGLYYCTVETDREGAETFQIQTKPVRRIGAKNRIKGLKTQTTVEELIRMYDKWGIDPKLKQAEEVQAEQEVLQEEADSLFGDDIDSLLK